MPKPRNQSPSSPADAGPVVLDHRSFWIFNDGPADRFGLFKKEEQKKVETEQQLQQGRIAYNYQRYNREIEQTGWSLFFQKLTDRLFTEFDHILVEPDGRIMGIKNHHSRLLSTHPDAYSTARKASKSLSTK
jgi:hypothetical protein